VIPVALDVAPPSVSLAALPVATLAASVRLAWSGSDSGSGVASYDVKYRRAAWNSTGFGAWILPSTWQRIGVRTRTLSLAPGFDYCVSVRARDAVGNTSDWSAPRCVARALDDRSLVAGRGWTRATASGYYLRTITSTTRLGAVLVRTGARLDRVGIVATRCATCGIVGVYVGNRLMGKVNLAAPTLRRQQLLMLPRFSYRAGTIVLRSLTTRKLVQIDGLVITRT
jgi:hypothetical protein